MKELTRALQKGKTFSKEFRITFSAQAEDIVSRMSLSEKIRLMSGHTNIDAMVGFDLGESDHYNQFPYPAGGCKKHGVPEILFCDGPRGVVCGVNRSTCFPVSMARGATFDIDLEERIGEAIGQEIIAYQGNFFGGVCVNLPYHPGWGRSQETYGEESFHLGQMGSALVRGVQKMGVVACVKHFAFNSMEISRYKVSIECDTRTEREVFLPHFKECVDAGAASVMTAYNRYRGEYCGQNGYLIRDILKGEWGFDGFVISDFGLGIRDTELAANSGMDVEMCDTKIFGQKLIDAVKGGIVSEDNIDKSAIRIVRTMLAADHHRNYSELPDNVIGSLPHRQLALEAAEKSITLLKNENQTLPLSKSKIKSLALIGALADEENLGDYGSSRVYPPYVISPFDGIADLNYCEVIYNDGSNIESAKKLAQSVDAVVFLLGYRPQDEGEFVPFNQQEYEAQSPNQPKTKKLKGFGGDRCESLSLHESDIELINHIAPLNSCSVVVLIGGNMILIDDWKDMVPSILMAYYPGMEGGTALGKILFGDVNPSGKLPFVLVKDEKDLPAIDWDTDEQFYGYYHGYAKLEKEGITPSLPYGFGLSYTQFTYSNPEFKVDNNVVYGKCEVENTGKVDGEEIVQLYIGFDHSLIDRPHKLLRGFTRVSLKAGHKTSVTISCPVEKICWYDEETGEWEIEHMTYQAYIGPNSSDEALLKGQFEL